MTRKILATVLIALTISLAAAAQTGKSSKMDDQIIDQVKLKLAGDPNVNGGAIDVDAKDGVVVLMGKVRTDRARQKAESLAKKVKGVKSVDNQLKVDTLAH